MDAVYQRVYRFEGFILDVTRRILRTVEREVELRPKSFDVLCCLVEHAGRLVPKHEFFEAVWPGMAVTDESLTRCVSDVRLAVGDREQRIVKTIPGRGYLLAVPVSRLPGVIESVSTSAGGNAIQVAPSPPDGRRGNRWLRRLASAARFTTILVTCCALLAVTALAVAIRGWLEQSAVVEKENKSPSNVLSLNIAVLPFTASIAGHASEPTIAETLSDEVRDYLSRISSLRIVSREATRQIESRPSGLQSMWSKGALRYTITGSVLAGDGKLSVSVGLIDVSSQLQVWSKRFENPPGEWPPRHDDVARRIAYAVQVETIQREGADLGSRIADLSVSQLLASGWASLMGWGVLRLDHAQMVFNEALRRDPECMSAMLGLAGSKLLAASNLKGDRARHMVEAEALLRKALLKGGATDFIAYFYLGVLHKLKDNAAAALQAYERSIELNPSFAPGHAYRGRVLIRMSRYDEALQSIEYAYRLAGKVVSGWQLWQGIAELQLGQDKAAGDSFLRAVAALPENPYVHAALASYYALRDEWKDARVHVDELRRRTPAMSDQWRLVELNKGSNDQPLRGRLGEGLRLALEAQPEFH